MKLAIISDTHFGDPDCQLVRRVGNGYVKGEKYQGFHDALKSCSPLDYLVLAGDILDFSVAEYSDAYGYAKAFFEFIIRDGIVRPAEKDDDKGGGFIYLAGNHDADIWHIIQHERSVINRVMKGETPTPYDHAVPAVMDDRALSATKGLTLCGVEPYGNKDGYRYGGMFFDGLLKEVSTRMDTPENRRYHFNFAFPNLYIVTDTECVLVTHGQYFEPYWSILGQLIKTVAGQDIGMGEPADPVSMEDLVAINYPLNQLACTGVGQAGILTDRLVRPLRGAIGAGKYKQFSIYLDRSKDFLIDSLTAGASCCVKLAGVLVKKFFPENALITEIRNSQNTRYRKGFIDDPAVRARFERFFKSSCEEVNDINKSQECRLPIPSRVIFGHTHQPIAWADPSPPSYDYKADSGTVAVKLHNSGGWLKEGDKPFCEAEIFIYESGKGFYSVRVK